MTSDYDRPHYAPTMPSTQPVPPPPPPPQWSPRAALAERLATAETRVRERERLHALALRLLENAKTERTKHPDSAETRQALVSARAELDISADDAEAARGALEQLREQLDSPETKAAVTELEALAAELDHATVRAGLEPIAERVEVLFSELVVLARSARDLIRAVQTSEAHAQDLARKLGLTFRRRVPDIDDARRIFKRAVASGMRQAAFDQPMRFWIEL